MEAKICVLIGSAHAPSHCHTLAHIAGDAAKDAGAEVRFADLAKLQLPVMLSCSPQSAEQDALPGVCALRETAAWANGFIIATPEYHGCMSGALKNAFDFLYPQIAGKMAGLLAATGGGTGDMSLGAVQNTFLWCHGFVLPYRASAQLNHFDAEHALVDNNVRDRVIRVGVDVARYSPGLFAKFEEARALGKIPQAGFAGSP